VRGGRRQEAGPSGRKVLRGAELIAVTLPSLCEFVWVLRRVYQFGQEDIVAALEALLNAENVAVNRPAADAGLLMLKAGGDFEDGLIAYEGAWLGGDTFVSFDKQAFSLLSDQGKRAKLLQ
jgi:predicted nucleic-acid-binding protein